MSFDNLTVYKKKADFENTNISIYSGNNKSIIFNITSFPSDSTEPLAGNIVYNGSEKTNLSIEISGLPFGENDYNLSFNGTSKTLQNGKIDTKLNLSGNSSIKLSEISGSGDSAQDNSGGSSSSGGSGGGGSGGGGALGGSLADTGGEDENFTVAEVRFERENLSVRIQNESEKIEQIVLQNTGNRTSSGNIEVESLPVTEVQKNVEVARGESVTLNPVFNGERNTSGRILYHYGNGTARLPVNVEVYSSRAEIDSKLEYSNGSLSYTVNVSGASKGERLQTVIYSEDGETVYKGNASINSSSEKIVGRVEKSLDSGNYTMVNELLSDGVSEAESSDEIDLVADYKNSNRVPYMIIAVGLLLVTALAVEINRKRKIQQEVKENVDEIKEEVDEPGEKPLEKIIRDKIDEGGEEDEKLLNKCLEESKEILNDMKSLEEMPEITEEKEKQVRKALREENYEEVKRHLDELSERVNAQERYERKGYGAEFEEINGVGEDLSRKLSEKFGSFEDLRAASAEDLEEVKGVGEDKAEDILDQVS